MPSCSVFWCKNQSKTSNRQKDGVSFHLFPKELSTRAEWIKACNNHVTWVPKRTSTVCSLHFETACFSLLDNNKRRIKKDAVPTLQLFKGCVSNQSKKKSKPQKQEYDPLKEFANDSTDDEILSDAENSDDESVASITEEVQLKTKKQSKDSSTGLKRSRLETSKDSDYIEQLYEFGNYVAQQLMCLDIEDARVAKAKIVAMLSKFDMDKKNRSFAEPSISNVQPGIDDCITEVKIEPQLKVEPIVSLETKSGSQLNTGSSVTQFINVNTTGPSVTQSGMILGAGFEVLNVNLGAGIVPISTTTLNISTQQRNTEVTLATVGSGNCVGSTATQSAFSSMICSETSVKTEPDSESSVCHINVSPGTSVTQPGCSSMILSETSLKTEPDPLATHSDENTVQSSVGTGLLRIKFEPDSEEET